MLRDEIIRKLRGDWEWLERFGVKSIAVFGAVARNEAGPDSDVDILVDYDSENVPGLFGFLDLQEHLEEVLGRKIDLVVRDGLRPRLRSRILAEALQA